MKRFFVFTVLFPPLVLIVYIAADPVWRREPLEIGFMVWILAWTYLFAVVPAWLTAAVDRVLAAKPSYLRLVATMAVAAVLAELTARYLGQRDLVLTVAMMGAIPAAVCSWLSSQPNRSAT